MRETLTVSLSEEMRDEISRAARRQGISKSEFVRNALKVALFRRALAAARAELVPRARKKGLYIDEDAFRIIS